MSLSLRGRDARESCDARFLCVRGPVTTGHDKTEGPDTAIYYCGKPPRRQSLAGAAHQRSKSTPTLTSRYTHRLMGSWKLPSEGKLLDGQNKCPARPYRREEGKVRPDSCRGGIEPHRLVLGQGRRWDEGRPSQRNNSGRCEALHGPGWQSG